MICRLVATLILIFTVSTPARSESQTVDNAKNNAETQSLFSSSDQYKRLLERIETIQAESPDAFKAAELLNDFSVFLIENDAWFVSMPLVEMAQKLCPKDSTTLSDFIEITKASVLYLEGDLDAAEKVYYDQYTHLLSHPELVNEAVRVAIDLGELNQRKGRKKEALKYFEQAVAMADSIGSHFLYAAATIHAERLEDNARVQLEMLEKCREAVFEGDCATLMAPALLALARFHFRQGDYSLAIEEIDKACTTARKLNQIKYEIEGLELWARVYQRKYDMSMSLTCQQRASELSKSFQQQNNINASIYDADATKFLLWCENSFFNNAAKEDNIFHGNGWWWLAAILICIGAIGCCLINTRWKRKYHMLQENMEENLKEKGKEEAEKAREMQNALVKLEIIYEGFGGMLARIRASLKAIKASDTEVSSKLKDLSAGILQNSLPERKNDFLTMMEEEDAKFISNLEAKIKSELNPSDKKMALYLRHGLTTQEISALTGLLPKSVNQSRYRLRRTLGLEQEDGLEEYLQSDITD